jgi:hypothetical protein
MVSTRLVARSRPVGWDSIRAALAVLIVGCGQGGETETGRWQVEYETRGDTVVVRTVAGSVWGDTGSLVPSLTIGVLEGADEYVLGSIRSLAAAPDGSVYAYDSHSRELRKYAPDGTYVMTLGRSGSGPGEYKKPDGGLAVLPDGRVVLRDPGNARITVYSPDGDYLKTWPTRYPWNTPSQLMVDTAGNSYSAQVLNPRDLPADWEEGLVVRGPDGRTIDTLALPNWEYERPELTNRGGLEYVPFAPLPVWTLSPFGYLVAGLPTRYRLCLYPVPDQTLCMEREDWTPVPVASGERDEQRRLATASMRQSDPGWTWNGPPIPSTKPPYHALFVGEDGRVWLRLHQRADAVRSDGIPNADGTSLDEGRETWVERAAFDVFTADGSYLGFVKGPSGMLLNPTPVARGDTVWAVVEDDLEVQRIARLTIEFEP